MASRRSSLGRLRLLRLWGYWIGEKGRQRLRDRLVRRGDWLKGDLPFGRALRHRKLGIVGLGRIGQAIATRCAAFGMEIAYYGPRRKADVAYAYFADPVALAQSLDLNDGPAHQLTM